ESSTVPLNPFVITSSARAGARFPLARVALVFPLPAPPPSPSPCGRGEGEGLFPSRNFFFAVSSNWSRETTSSIRPSCLASCAEYNLPFTITSAAFSAPIRRGRRVQPPQAGIKPSVVSGKPIRVAGSSLATRQSHVSVISYPPPAQAP